jgi:hypothetical protein
VIRAHKPGGIPAADASIPGFRPYVYRGLGYDQFAPGAPVAARQRSAAVLQRIASGDLTPYARPAPVEVTRQEIALDLCRACLLDMCEACFGGTCKCACIDTFAVAVQPEPEPSPDDRCPVCTYPYESIGHRVSCDTERLTLLADSIGRRA